MCSSTVRRTGSASDDDVTEMCLRWLVVVATVLTAPHDTKPVGRVWTQVMYGHCGHVHADLMYAHRLPIRVQSTLSLVPQHTRTPAINLVGCRATLCTMH